MRGHAGTDSAASRAFVEQRHPGRTSFVRGSSMFTLQALLQGVRSGAASECNLWMVDGNHGPETRPSQHAALLSWPGRDLEHAVKASADGALIIADDCTQRFPDVLRAWAKLRSLGWLYDDWQVNYTLAAPVGIKGWCVGRANGKLARSASGLL